MVKNRLTTLFVTDHHKLVSAAVDRYRDSLEPLPHCQQPGAELVSILSETTLKQFSAMFPTIESLGFARSTEPLDKRQDASRHHRILGLGGTG